MTEQAYWRELQKLGWLDFLSSAQQRSVKTRLKKCFRDNPEYAYLCLSQTGFDSECIDEPGAYRNVLKMIASDSEGVFQPTHIKEEYLTLSKRRYAIKISFRHKRQAFAVTVPHETDWFDMAVIELANQALEAFDRTERFIVLPSEDQFVFLAIVPPGLYKKAVAKKLIPRS